MIRPVIEVPVLIGLISVAAMFRRRYLWTTFMRQNEAESVKSLLAANQSKPFLMRDSHPYNRPMISLPLDSSRIVVMMQA
jgi:hypothetical protein